MKWTILACFAPKLSVAGGKWLEADNMALVSNLLAEKPSEPSFMATDINDIVQYHVADHGAQLRRP